MVDRPAWAAAAVHGMKVLTAGARLPEVSAVARAVTARTAGLQLGGVVAYLGGRVLGQYDPFGGPAGDGRLLLVAPNVHAAQQALDVPSADFGLWVCLHEATHRLQFTAVPWLRSYFADEVGRFLSIAQVGAAGPDGRPALFERLPEVVRAIRSSGGRLAGHRRAAAGARAAGRAGPAARPDHAVGGPRRPRDGRGRTGGGARRGHHPGPVHRCAAAAAG